jgi:signal peptidase I
MPYLCLCCVQVDGPSMFPTFTGRGDWVLVEALPGFTDRIEVGEYCGWAVAEHHQQRSELIV